MLDKCKKTHVDCKDISKIVQQALEAQEKKTEQLSCENKKLSKTNKELNVKTNGIQYSSPTTTANDSSEEKRPHGRPKGQPGTKNTS